MTKTTIQAELPPELTARVTESMVMSDVQWGLHGDD